MDYEKKYKEALDRARIYRDNAKAVEEYSAVARYENIFPELRESEDERIRKEIINYLDFAESHNLLRAADYEKKKEWLDYLEKQKEQNPAWSEEDEKMRNLAIEWAETMYGQSRFVDMGSTDFRKIVAWLKSLRPQSKVEWNDKDEEYLARIDRALVILETDSPHINTADDRKWLKSLRPSWKPSEEQMDALERASTNKYLSAKQFDILVSLHEQLKKL